MFDRVLAWIERVGNKLPHPAMLFVWLVLIVVICSAVLSVQVWPEFVHPSTSDPIGVNNLLSQAGLNWFLTHAVTNFTHFVPLGTVLVAMLGIGLAEASGLMLVGLKRLALLLPDKLLSLAMVLLGVLSSIAADAAYVMLIPLGAALFLAAGRNPLVGIGATFAGVSAGYCANIIITPLDIILSGLSTQAVQTIQPDYVVGPAANYFIMLVLTLVFGLAGAWVTDFIVSPRMKVCPTDAVQELTAELTQGETKALSYALIALAIYIGTILLAIVPEDGVLRNPVTGALQDSPFMSGLIVLIAIGFAIAGIVFGYVSDRFKSASDVMTAMEASMSTMASYIVLMFFAAQFISCFNWTNLGLLAAMSLVQGVQALSISPVSLLMLLMVAVALLNLFIGSSSAKWAFLAPVVVPVFSLLDVAPDVVQAAYRIADSSTNIITPMMPYFGMVVAFARRYAPDVGMGTLTALMLPYSVVFFGLGMSTLILWYWLGLPMGV